MKNFILSLFGRKITKCDYCPSTFRGSTEAGYQWLGYHIAVCPQAKLAFSRFVLEEHSPKPWPDICGIEPSTTIPGWASVEFSTADGKPYWRNDGKPLGSPLS